MPELEDPQYWQRNFQRNQAWLRPGKHVYSTPLQPAQEFQFRQWLRQNKVPFDPSLPTSDYDMRGFWSALQRGDPVAKSAVDPNDNLTHYPDYWKTPYSPTFSAESQWANPQVAPRWTGDLYHLPDGQVLWNDKLQQWTGPNAPWSSTGPQMLQQQDQLGKSIPALRMGAPL